MAPSFAHRPFSPAHRLRLAGGTVGGSVELSVIVAEASFEMWAEFQQSGVDDAVDQWRKRLEASILAEGGHFEHWFPEIPFTIHHNRFFPEPPMPIHNRVFSEPPTFGGKQHTRYLQSDDKVVHFARYCGDIFQVGG